MIKLRLGAGGAGGFVILPITKGNRALPIHINLNSHRREKEKIILIKKIETKLKQANFFVVPICCITLNDTLVFQYVTVVLLLFHAINPNKTDKVHTISDKSHKSVYIIQRTSTKYPKTEDRNDLPEE